MLEEYKNDRFHYFEDDRSRIQGEYKSWHKNGQLREHRFYVDCRNHGEYKAWYEDGTIRFHEFWVHGEVYRDLLEEPVDDKDKFIITLETGGKWIC